MPKLLETVLATLPASSVNERLQIVLCHEVGVAGRLELRQQSRGEGVGWFTQTSVQLEPQQVAELKGVLGVRGSRTRPQRQASFLPRVVSAESA